MSKTNIPLALVCLLVTSLVAGCLSPESPNSAETDTATPSFEEPVFETYSASRYTQAALTGGVPLPGSEGGGTILEFTVSRNVSAIFVEVAWNDTIQDLDARLRSSGVTNWCNPEHPLCIIPLGAWGDLFDEQVGVFNNREGNVGDPDSPSRILLQGEPLKKIMDECGDDCPWYAGARTKIQAWYDIEWHAFVTVFYDDQEKPEGYTAIPWLKE